MYNFIQVVQLNQITSTLKIQADDPEIDMFAGGWGTGYDQTHLTCL